MKFNTKFEERQSVGESNDFINLKDKQSISGVFRGEIHEFYQHWPKGGTKSVCPGSGCDMCDAGDRARFQFRLNLVIKDGNGYVAKIFEKGRRDYETLRGLSADYKLEETAVKITRAGSEMNNTKYSIVPVPPKQQPTPETLKQIAAVKLFDFTGSKQEETEVLNDLPEDCPF